MIAFLIPAAGALIALGALGVDAWLDSRANKKQAAKAAAERAAQQQQQRAAQERQQQRDAQEQRQRHEAQVLDESAKIARAACVVVYSANFQGKVEAPRLNKRIESGLHLDREEAELELRLKAIQVGAFVVQCVRFVSVKCSDPSNPAYVRSAWKVTGVI